LQHAPVTAALEARQASTVLLTLAAAAAAHKQHFLIIRVVMAGQVLEALAAAFQTLILDNPALQIAVQVAVAAGIVVDL
jgi:hypothetical protein